MKKSLTALCVLFATFALVACTTNKVCYDHNNPQDVARTFAESFCKNDAITILKLTYLPNKVVSEDVQDELEISLQEIKKQNDKKGGCNSVITKKPEYFMDDHDNKYANVKIIVTFKNGAEKHISSRLVLTANGWKIKL